LKLLIYWGGGGFIKVDALLVTNREFGLRVYGERTGQMITNGEYNGG